MLSSQDQWQGGTVINNIDTTSAPGSMKIDNKALVQGREIDISGATATSTGPLGGDIQSAVGATPCVCTWNWATNENGELIQEPASWTVDIGRVVDGVIHLVQFDTGLLGDIAWQISINGTDWTNLTTFLNGGSTCGYGFDDTTIFSEQTFRYFRILINVNREGYGISGFKVYEPSLATATHISAPMQITDPNLYQWQTFTPTYTKPANTDVKFRFRTSTDATNWTDWSNYQTPASGSSLDLTSIVTSKTGPPGSETFYKYLQVETTLSNTDGTSTPTVDSYTIGYHTNRKPNKPIAQTAVIRQ